MSCMDEVTKRQVRGVVELARDAVDGTAVALLRAHGDIARSAYRILAKVKPIAPAVRAIEEAQQVAMECVYGTISMMSVVTATAVIAALDIVDAQFSRSRTTGSGVQE